MIRLAVVGDIHRQWSEADVTWFDQAGYDAILVVGDLAGFRYAHTQQVASSLSRLQTRTVLVPGNHDTAHAIQLLAESVRRPALGRPFKNVQARNLAAMREAFLPHELGAYSLHPVGDVTVLAARPHSMGGPTLSFRPHLADTWGIDSLDASAARLAELIDACPTDRIVIVAHNGPAGLGDQPTDIWGCDFRREGGDWGDPDLEAALVHARARGKKVLAVCAGHMHRRVRGGGQRTWKLERDGTVFVNAAEVPRIDRTGRRHHVSVTLEGETVSVEDVWVEA